MTAQEASVDERQAAMARDDYRRELGDGLALRWSRPADVDGVCELYSQVFRQSESSPPGWTTPMWTHDMFSGRHPHIGPRDFALVEDTRTGNIVAATCLLRYTCAYEGIPFGFGRPELVATQVEYRNRGLIRAIFELLHARSAARGDLVQGITGIEYYYRQFGYEYATPLLDQQGFTVSFAAIPSLKADAAEPYILRAASLDDVPLLQCLWRRTGRDMALTTDIDDAYWRWAMAGVNPDALEGWRVYRIERSSRPTGTGETATSNSPGEPGIAVGAVVLAPRRWSATITVKHLLLDEGVPLARRSITRGDSSSRARRHTPGCRDSASIGRPSSAQRTLRPDFRRNALSLRVVPARCRPAGIPTPHYANSGVAPQGVRRSGLHRRADP
jgi:hypothetical protein